MQRTICGGYQPSQSRTDDSLTLIQGQNTHSVTTGASVSQQLHWKRKIINKQGLNKCRQNPARQAAVRSFKKYHFTNQDFLLRKYLRSVKKEMKPKQCEATESSSSNTIVSTEACSSISRSLVNNSCVKQRNEIKNKNCSAIQNSNNNSSVSNNNSSTNSALPSTILSSATVTNKVAKSNQHQDNADIMASKHQPINIDEELKLCERKNWPTYGVEQPTYETVLHECPSYILCNNETKDSMNDPSLILEYCESLKQLAFAVECANYNYSERLSDNSRYGNTEFYKLNTKNIKSNEGYYRNNCHANNNYIIENKRKECVQDIVHVNGNQYPYDDDCSDDEDEDDDDDDEDDDENEEDEDEEDDEEDDCPDDDDEEKVNGVDEYDYDEDNVNDGYDDIEDDDDDDDYEDDNSGNAICYKYRGYNSYDKSNSDNKIKKSSDSPKSVINTNKNKKSSKVVEERKSAVVSIDTSDSSSVSSNQDNSSVSTETCCSDVQTNASNDIEDSNNNALSVNDGCLIKFKQQNNTGTDQSQNTIRIRNREYPLSILDNNPTLVKYIKNTSSQQIIATDQSQSVIKIRNREYPLSILDNNPTLVKYLKNTSQHNNAGTDQFQNVIKIKNREYPVSILDDNPTPGKYFKNMSPQQEIDNKTESVSLSDGDKCDIQSLMCNESEENVLSLSRKNNVSSSSKKNVSPRYSKRELVTPRLSKSADLSNQLDGCAAINRYKNLSTVKDKLRDQLKQSSDSKESSNTQLSATHNCRTKGLQKSNIGKGKNHSYEPILSTVCSVEDGLAFLDNQNQHPTPCPPHTSSTSQHNETITLYNSSTSCTLPVLGPTTDEVSSKSKSKRHNQKNEHLLPNSVASQTTFSPARQQLSSFQGTKSFCSKCKLADDNLKDSIHESFGFIKDLLKSTVVLNSLVTGQCQKDIVKKICE